jgi:hypothetical protein
LGPDFANSKDATKMLLVVKDIHMPNAGFVQLVYQC